MYKRFFHGIKLVSLFSYLSIFLFRFETIQACPSSRATSGWENLLSRSAIQPANQYLCVSDLFISHKFWLLIGSPNVV